MLDKTILNNLIYNEEFARKALPFLKDVYFQSRVDKTLFNLVSSYITKYNTFPSKEALRIEIDNTTGVTADEIGELNKYINDSIDEKTDTQWLLDQTEKFCQDKAIYNAIMESITILDGKHNLDKGSIPEILSKALAVSFDTHIGHDFLDDYEARYEFYHRKEKRIAFDLDYFNDITKGGLPTKTLNIALAGCVHPETKIRVRLRK